MLFFILACQGEHLRSTDTQAESDTAQEVFDTADVIDTSEASDTADTIDSSEPAMYLLSVDNGYGEGLYEAGEIVHVFADFMPGNEVVTHWSGDLDLSPEWHHQFTMPTNDVTLEAHVETTTYTLTEIQYPGVQGDIRLLYAVPSNPVGVLFLFHGTTGSADVAYATPFQNIAATAYRQGLAIVSTDAHERTTNDAGNDGKIRWNVAPNLSVNIDLQNIQKISQDISTLTSVPSDGVRLGVGISNGGAFAITAGGILSFTAVTSLCATGREDVYTQTQTPTQWLMCENDTNETVSSKRDEWENGTNSLMSRGVRTDYGVFSASPLYNERFTRFGATISESQAIIEELKTNQALDEHGFLHITPKSIQNDILDNPDRWPIFLAFVDQYGYKNILGELKQAYADHGAFDDWTHRMIDFWKE